LNDLLKLTPIIEAILQRKLLDDDLIENVINEYHRRLEHLLSRNISDDEDVWYTTAELINKRVMQ